MEGNLKILVEKLKDKSGRTASSIARDLIQIGMDVNRQEGIQIIHSLGFKMRFATISFGGEKKRLGIRLEDSLTEELQTEFNCGIRDAIRQALRLGALTYQPEKVRVVGPVLGIKRRFATVEAPKIQSERAREALRRLQSIPEP